MKTVKIIFVWCCHFFITCGVFFLKTTQIDFDCNSPKCSCLFSNRGPFITNDFAGQLGNQLYQAAAGISLALDHNCRYVLSKLDYPQVLWRIPYDRSLKIKNVFTGFKNGYDKTNNFISIEYKENLQLNGYFLSHKYFDHHRDIIVKLFGPSKKIKDYIFSKHQTIMNHPKTVGVHVRTYYQDYLSEKLVGRNIYKNFPGPNMFYIEHALQIFSQDSLFVVCSDNIAWTKKAFQKLPGNFCFIANEELFVDFYLLSLCKHNIISNSSFSWWAAYLNENSQKIVVAPVPYAFDSKRKIEDTYPANWILVKRVEDGLIPNFEGEKIWNKW